MRHRRARRMLSALPDGLLPAETEVAVRRHVGRCTVCLDALAELEAADALLRRLPATLLPLEPCSAAQARLTVLARWSGRAGASAGPAIVEPTTRPARLAVGARWGIPAVGAMAAAACLAGLLVSVVPLPGGAPIDDRDEAFNFVLASSFAPAESARSHRHVAATGAVRPASARGQESDTYYLPGGAY